MSHRQSCAAGPHEHDVAEGRVRQPLPEALGEAVGVGVVAAHPTIGKDNGVNGTDRGSIRREAFDVMERRLLEGVRDVEAVEPERPRCRDHRRERIVGEAEAIEVEQPVNVA